MAIAPNRPANPDARGNAAPCKRRRTYAGCRDRYAFLIVMNQNLKRSVIAILERAGSVAQAGSRAAPEEMMALNQECGGIIPGWYIELVTTYPLCGLELGWQSSAPDEDDDGVSWMHWSDPAGMRREMLEYYPGVAIHGRGYINVAGCSHGTGDPYFIRARDGDDPAVIQVAHDVSDDPELILRDGIFVVAGRLSELFTNAFVSAT
jgi:hypothetical protein